MDLHQKSWIIPTSLYFCTNNAVAFKSISLHAIMPTLTGLLKTLRLLVLEAL